MFLCAKCHDPDCPGKWIEGMSFGRCEGCGQGARCWDCHGYKMPTNATLHLPEPPPQVALHLAVTDQPSVAVCGAEPGVSWRDDLDAFAPDFASATCKSCTDTMGGS